jgi:hypothetical protein
VLTGLDTHVFSAQVEHASYFNKTKFFFMKNPEDFSKHRFLRKYQQI